MTRNLFGRSLAVAATAALAMQAVPAPADGGATWEDLDRIIAAPGSCSLIVYADENGNRLPAPPPGVEPIRYEPLPLDRVQWSARPDGSVAGRLYTRPTNEAARGTAMVTGSASTFMVNYNDSAAEGFFDTTAVAPVGGNTGTTRGQQRRMAYEFALLQIANELNSTVPIVIDVQFDPLFCSMFGALLGQAGPDALDVNFPGAPLVNTIYPGALTNALTGSDVNASGDISSAFNSNIDTGCFLGGVWYYGLDNNPGVNIDFLGTALHETYHGLGFTTFVDLATGARLAGFNDHYMIFLRDNSTSTLWSSMSDGQRQASAIDTGDLVWNGSEVNTRNGYLSAGNLAGRTRMYAPNPLELGSSVAHWDTVLTPDEVMEPVDTGTTIRTLTRALMGDIGYTGVVPVEISTFELE